MIQPLFQRTHMESLNKHLLSRRREPLCAPAVTRPGHESCIWSLILSSQLQPVQLVFPPLNGVLPPYLHRKQAYPKIGLVLKAAILDVWTPENTTMSRFKSTRPTPSRSRAREPERACCHAFASRRRRGPSLTDQAGIRAQGFRCALSGAIVVEEFERVDGAAPGHVVEELDWFSPSQAQ